MKIKKHIVESIIEEELHAVLQERRLSLDEDWKSAFVRGLTRGGKRSNVFTDTLAAMMVPGLAGEAYKSLGAALKSVQGMKSNSDWQRVTRGEDMGIEADSLGKLKCNSLSKNITINGIEILIKGIMKDMQVLGAQLGADKPEMEDPEGGAAAPEAPGEDAASEEGDDSSEPVPTTESLRRSIKAKMRRLKSTS